VSSQLVLMSCVAGCQSRGWPVRWVGRFDAQGLVVCRVIAERIKQVTSRRSGGVPWLGENAGSLMVWPGSSLVP
jgi:hypothetical protein